MREAKVPIRDVAKKLGIGVSTVQRAVKTLESQSFAG
jgi:DNA-binding Lrp family transcriptional regulator